MKGAILSINPDARFVDITNDISPQNIFSGCFTLASAYDYFPDGTIHIGVIDPGVGSKRKNIAIRSQNYFFIGPDNGLFSFLHFRDQILEIREIKNPPFISDIVSGTFHGRDVYAPCAGYLSAGRDFSNIGPVVSGIMLLNPPKPKYENNALIGEIVSIDSFGNLISNISRKQFDSFLAGSSYEIYFSSERFTQVHTHYASVEFGKPLVVFGSSGFLEISMNGGNASLYFMTSVGNLMTLRKV